MRFHLVGLALLASVAMPAVAQQADRLDRRVDRLEQEMRAVQRRVFPGANGSYIGPEIAEKPAPVQPQGVPAGTAVSDLNARIDAVEAQLASLTGQIEQNGNRLRQLEAGFASLRESTTARLDALEKPSAAAQPLAPDQQPQASRDSETEPKPAASPSTSPAAADAEAAYNAGFRLWEQKRYADAQKALEAVSQKWPNHRFASWAANLAGRAYLDDGKPAAAAKVLLANYQGNPKGERAADSLFFLGQALVALGKPDHACKAYDELREVYGDTIRDYLKDRLPRARSQAKCA